MNSDRLGNVRDVVAYLSRLEQAYDSIYSLDILIKDIQAKHEPRSLYSARRAALQIRRIPDPHAVVLPDDKLRLSAISIESPGFWEFIGALNPLETIRKYLVDRHERRKDGQYRDALDAERMRLENERLRTQAMDERADLLRRYGVSEDRIREALTRYVLGPLSQLDAVQDAGVIDDATIIDEQPTQQGEQSP